MTIRTNVRTLCLVMPLVLVSGCAAHYTHDAVRDPYGFFYGLWHGFVFPYALVANLVSWLAGLIGFSIMDTIEIVGRPNTGLFYYIGFALGLVPYGGGAR